MNATKLAWPSGLLEQVTAVRGVADEMRRRDVSITVEAVAKHFKHARRSTVVEILATFYRLGFLV